MDKKDMNGGRLTVSATATWLKAAELFMTLLRIDSSAATQGSVSRALTDRIIAALAPDTVITRDLAKTPPPLITEDWINARALPEAERTPAQKAELEISDTLVAELAAADTIVIGLPIYNFAAPAALKAWVDLIARVGVTFRYTPNGPEGLLKGKRAILAMASGGTAAGSDIDFASGYMRHVLGFVGITDVTLISADALAKDPDGTMARAHAAIETLPKAA